MAGSILIAEDQWILLDILQRILADAGYAVRTCSTAQDVLALARELEPDVILLDGHLIGGSGWDLLPLFQAENLRSRVIMMTGDLQNSEQAGLCESDPSSPFAVLEKPFRMGLLKDVISSALLGAAPTTDMSVAA